MTKTIADAGSVNAEETGTITKNIKVAFENHNRLER